MGLAVSGVAVRSVGFGGLGFSVLLVVVLAGEFHFATALKPWPLRCSQEAAWSTSNPGD